MSDTVKGFICFVLTLPIKIYCIAPMIRFLVGTEWQDKNSWVSYIIAFGVACIIIIMFEGKGNKICAWCSSSKIKFGSGKEGNWFWEYRNKDNSKDKRVKGNVQQAGYTSIYNCKECNADTIFRHFVDKKPGPNIKIWKRELSKEGKGKKTGTDWSESSAVDVKTSGENRKSMD